MTTSPQALPYQGSDLRARVRWLRVSKLLTAGYILFGLILIGVPGPSRGGIVFAGLSLLWLVYGVARGYATFPPVLRLPVAFFGFALLSGTMLMKGFDWSTYPTEYMLQMTTIWVGGIAVAAFVANGVPLGLVIAGFVAVSAANFAAIAVGYDGYQINIKQQDMAALEGVEIERVSGLAGQSNLLVGLVFTLPFLMFLTRRKAGMVSYLVVLGSCVAVTILTGSRSGIALALLFFASGTVFLIRSVWIRVVAVAFCLGAAGYLYAFFADPMALSKIEASPLGELVVVKRVFEGLDGVDKSAEKREEMAKDFWPEFLVSPVIGHGPDMFKEVTGSGMYAHNNHAEIAVNWGLAGLALYYAMYVQVLRGILRSLHSRLPATATLVFLIVCDPWFVVYLYRPFVLCLCLLLIATASERDLRGRRWRLALPHVRWRRRRRRRRRPPRQAEPDLNLGRR